MRFGSKTAGAVVIAGTRSTQCWRAAHARRVTEVLCSQSSPHSGSPVRITPRPPRLGGCRFWCSRYDRAMSSGHDPDHAVLSPGKFLEHLRTASRRLIQSDAVSDLRCSCDDWAIGGGRIDPIEPLANRGRRAISWPTDTWSSISTDLLGALQRAVEDENGALPAALAEYAAFVHLELAAIEDPPQGIRTEAFVLPLIIAAKERVSSTDFRRYAQGWRIRAGSLSWNDPEMALAASLVVALGSTDDAMIGECVRRIRQGLDDDGRSGRSSFRDFVRSDHRELWRRAASDSAPDARAWADVFMR